MRHYIFLSFAGLLFLTTHSLPAQGDQLWEKNEQCWLATLNKMIDSNELDQPQIFGIKYTLQEQRSMIELFDKYGLLNQADLQSRIDTITEMTRSKLNSLLTKNQLERWHILETRLTENGRNQGRTFAVFSLVAQ